MTATFKQVLCVQILAAGVIAGAFATPALAQESWDSVVAAGKKEGSVVVYHAQLGAAHWKDVVRAFESKYGIKVQEYDARASELTERIRVEQTSKRYVADVEFHGKASIAQQQIETDFIAELGNIPNSKNLRDDFPADKYSIPAWTQVVCMLSNTNLVKPEDEPKSWRDLLDPKWKGKMVWGSTAATSAGPGFIGHMLTVMGEEQGEAFVRELAGQKITGVNAAARQVLDQVIAGEYAIAINIFNNHPVISAQQGAPTTWLPMQPAMGVFSSMSVTKDAPHPNAGKLLIEYLMSTEGQMIFRDADYTPVNPNVAPRIAGIRADGVTLKAIYYTPEKIMASMPKWVDLFNRYFR
jgi:ABC-type Fe3+ transport system substrate-binding protein